MDDTISIFDVNRVKFLHHLEGSDMPGPDFPTGAIALASVTAVPNSEGSSFSCSGIPQATTVSGTL